MRCVTADSSGDPGLRTLQLNFVWYAAISCLSVQHVDIDNYRIRVLGSQTADT